MLYFKFSISSKFCKNFLSVKKTEDVSWNELKPMVISHLNHYFENNNSFWIRLCKKNDSKPNKINRKITFLFYVLIGIR